MSGFSDPSETTLEFEATAILAYNDNGDLVQLWITKDGGTRQWFIVPNLSDFEQMLKDGG